VFILQVFIAKIKLAKAKSQVHIMQTYVILNLF